MKKLNRELRQWEKIYNTVRPHQALGYLTPQLSAADLISTKGMKSVTHLLDEYRFLIFLYIERISIRTGLRKQQSPGGKAIDAMHDQGSLSLQLESRQGLSRWRGGCCA
jgi:hypothetical protein